MPQLPQYFLFVLLFKGLMLFSANALGEKMDNFRIYYDQSGQPIKAKLKFPTWFKTDLYDLPEDLREARDAGKRGVILFFSQSSCKHCRAYVEATFKDPAVKNRLDKSFDVIGMDIFSDVEVTDVDGTVQPVKDYVDKYRAMMTPTLVFFGVENKALLRILGFYPPEKFHLVLDYLEQGHYKNTKLSAYLRSQKNGSDSVSKAIVEDALLFKKPPYNLSSMQGNMKKPTFVLFETPDCKPCVRFHERVLTDKKVRNNLESFHSIQLDATDDSSVLITPDGRNTTPKQWADELQLVYDVSVVFFDEQGNEVFRSDAETGVNRMWTGIEYVLSKGYLVDKQIQRWRRKTRSEKMSGDN